MCCFPREVYFNEALSTAALFNTVPGTGDGELTNRVGGTRKGRAGGKSRGGDVVPNEGVYANVRKKFPLKKGENSEGSGGRGRRTVFSGDGSVAAGWKNERQHPLIRG